MKTYSPKLPIDLDKNNEFIMVDDEISEIKQNLKMILFTNPGEKIMDPRFGIGIRRYLFEMNTGFINVIKDDSDQKYFFIENYKNKISKDLSYQLSNYLPSVVLEDIEVESNDVVLNLKIKYNYKNFLIDTITINSSGA